MAEVKVPILVGVVNITTDSFSDGGRYLSPDAALTHAIELRDAGADIVELGAASSNPGASPVSSDTEICRLSPVMAELSRCNVPFSVDSCHPEVQSAAVKSGAAMLNDITAFADPSQDLNSTTSRLVLMHSVQRAFRADLRVTDVRHILDDIMEFFDSRLEVFDRLGISRERLILDPGMGYFLGSNPEASVVVLRGLPTIRRRFGLPLMVSVSRKGFLRAIAGCGVETCGPATLAAELCAASLGADYIRTHDVKALNDGLKVIRALTTLPDEENQGLMPELPGLTRID